jgi:2-methylisocitrate lyase-like PEP mutase family enzyme
MEHKTAGAADMMLGVGVHDALSAMLVEQAGFDVLWLGSFEASAHLGIPDSNVITPVEMAQTIRDVRLASTLPIYVDADNGYGSDVAAIRAVRMFHSAGATAVCIEDSAFPKRNSLRVDGARDLADLKAHARRIEELVRAADGIQIIARTEALVAERGIPEAVARLNTYVEAGAHAVFVQVNSATRDLLVPTLKEIWGLAPIVLAPTALPEVSAAEYSQFGVTVFIFANVLLRTLVRTAPQVLQRLRDSGRLSDVSDGIANIAEVLSLTGNRS